MNKRPTARRFIIIIFQDQIFYFVSSGGRKRRVRVADVTRPDTQQRIELETSLCCVLGVFFFQFQLDRRWCLTVRQSQQQLVIRRATIVERNRKSETRIPFEEGIELLVSFVRSFVVILFFCFVFVFVLWLDSFGERVPTLERVSFYLFLQTF